MWLDPNTYTYLPIYRVIQKSNKHWVGWYFSILSLKLHNCKLLILLHTSMYRYRKTRVGSHYGPIGHVWMHCRTYFMSKTSFWLWKMPLLTVKNVHIISHRKRAIALVFKMSWETWNSLSNDKMGLDNFRKSSLIHSWNYVGLVVRVQVLICFSSTVVSLNSTGATL